MNGAFDVTIVSQRLPSFRNIRATVTALQIECQFDCEYLNYECSNPIRAHKFPCCALQNKWNLLARSAEFIKWLVSSQMFRLGVLGWVVGFEPTTAGATVRSSTTELHPPYPKIITFGNRALSGESGDSALTLRR